MEKLNTIITVDGEEVFNYSKSQLEYVLTTSRLTNNFYERKITILVASLLEAELLFNNINSVKECINITIYDTNEKKLIEAQINNLNNFLLFTSTENNEIKVNLTLILESGEKEWE